MARKFQFSLDRRIINRLLYWMIKLGISPKNYYLLTIPGRRTGNPHTVPVALVAEGGHRWLVAPYGIVDWVRNARAAGKVLLTRGPRSESLAIRELVPDEAAPVLRSYMGKYPITRPYFDAKPDSPIDSFVQEAGSRPVFELLPSHPVQEA